MTEAQGTQLIQIVGDLQTQLQPLQAQHNALLMAVQFCFMALCALTFWTAFQALKR
jgi:hypothetical protein